MTETTVRSTKFDGMGLAYDCEPCGRCHGSGHHSRCDTWGTHCFKCGSPAQKGTGWQLTRRALKAKAEVDAWLAEHFTIAVKDVQPGMLVVIYPGRGAIRVDEVKEHGGCWSVDPKTGEYGPEQMALVSGNTSYGFPGTYRVAFVPTGTQLFELHDFARTLKGVRVAMDSREASEAVNG